MLISWWWISSDILEFAWNIIEFAFDHDDAVFFQMKQINKKINKKLIKKIDNKIDKG